MFKKFSIFYLTTNLHISFAAVCFYLESVWVYNQNIDFNYCLFIFFGTLAIYNAHKLIGSYKIKKAMSQSSSLNFLVYPKSSIALFVCSILGSFTFFYQLEYQTQQMLILPIVLSSLYILPITSKGVRLRDIPYIKIFVIAVCWTILCHSIPLKTVSALSFFERIAFMLAITIPFDIRDLKVDKLSQTKTLLTILKVEHAKTLAFGCLLISFMLLALSGIEINSHYFLSISCCYVLIFWLIKSSSVEKPAYFYLGYLDGTIILRSLCAVMFL